MAADNTCLLPAAQSLARRKTQTKQATNLIKQVTNTDIKRLTEQTIRTCFVRNNLCVRTGRVQQKRVFFARKYAADL